MKNRYHILKATLFCSIFLMTAQFNVYAAQHKHSLSDEEMHKIFVDNDEENFIHAINALKKKSPEQIERFIDFLFDHALDTKAVRTLLERLKNNMNASHVKKLEPYLYSEDKVQQFTSAFYLVHIGDPAFIALKKSINEQEKTDEINKTILSAIQWKGNLSRDNALSLFYDIAENTDTDNITSLNIVTTYNDFSSKARDVFVSCLNSQDSVTSYLTANRIARLHYRWSDEDKSAYKAVIRKRLLDEKNKETPKLESLMFYNVALFSLGEINSGTTNSLVMQLDNQSLNNRLVAAYHLLNSNVEKKKASNLLLKEIFNDNYSINTSVAVALQRLGMHTETLLPLIFEKIQKEQSERIRRKCLLYLHRIIKPVEPYELENRVLNLKPRTTEEQREISKIFSRYSDVLNQLATRSDAEKKYVEMILEHFPK